MESKVVGKHNGGNGDGSLRASITKANITTNDPLLSRGGKRTAIQSHAGRDHVDRGTAKTIVGKSTEKGRMGEQKRGKTEDAQCFPTLTAPCEFRWMNDDVCRMQHVNICQMMKVS